MTFTLARRQVLLGVGAALGGPARAFHSTRPPAPSPVAVAVEVVAGGLARPWGLAFLPDGSALVTEKAGVLKRIAGGRITPIAGVPPVMSEGQGGLFDVLPHPDFASNSLIYLSYAHGTRRANGTRLALAWLDGATLRDVTPLWTADPLKRGPVHFGGRMALLPDRTLLLTTGDGFDFREQAQVTSSPLGKVMRLTLGGKPAPGNPFPENPAVFSKGHRNPQGLAFDPVRGQVYATEHGPRGGDEVNRLASGGNYGWPVATRGRDYSGATISPFRSYEGMAEPLLDWTPSIAPSGLAVYRGPIFPQWSGDLLAGALVNREVRRVQLNAAGTEVLREERILPSLGARVRDVRVAPDGALWLLTDETPGQVLRVVRR
jgi:glucose/arabinose dehydrogenase